MKPLIIAVFVALAAAPLAAAEPAKRPNILWLSYEDSSPHLGCYGDANAHTPHIDAFAKQAVRYTHAFTVAGVCAPSRSGIITGMYPTTIGSQHMRSQAKLPAHIKTFPTYLREAGYYRTNNVKEDYNLKAPSHTGTWNESSGKAHYQGRKDGQPFFAVFNFVQSHESQFHGGPESRRKFPNAPEINPAKLTLPPYYPDTPLIRADWAQNYQSISQVDFLIGQKLKELDDAGLAEDTIVFIWSDHGDGLPRAKRWLYDSGTRVPLLVRIPAKFRHDKQAAPGSVDDQLISAIDLGPTVLNLAGVAVPEHMQGRAFLGPKLTKPREYVFSARDRMDERYDLIRSVRDKRYRYIRNYMPWVPYSAFIHYCEQGNVAKEWRKLHEAGKLTGPAKAWFADRKPVEELYDTEKDPHEVNNLAEKPGLTETLLRMRKAHHDWQDETRDLGLLPEVIMNEEAAKLGSQYEVLRQDDAIDRLRLLRHAASLPLGKEDADWSTQQLIGILSVDDLAVLTWAFTMEAEVCRWKPGTAGDRFVAYLNEPSPSLRIAAARGAWVHGKAQPAINELTKLLKHDDEHIRLGAILVLDEMGADAKPALDAVKAAKAADKGSGKYVARVATRIIGRLEGKEEPLE